MTEKILIGCPTYDSQEFCLSQFIQSLNNLSYKNADILFVDNSETNDYFEKLQKIKITNKKITVLKDKTSDIRISRIISSRNKIREYFLSKDYDYLFFLDTDIICPSDAIEVLLKTKKDIASGVYLHRTESQGQVFIEPVLYKPHGKDSVETVTFQEVLPEKIMDIAACGFGCCLIARKVLEKIAIRPFTSSTTGGEDIAFCVDAKKNGFSLAANTAVKCNHIGKNQVLSFEPSVSYSFG